MKNVEEQKVKLEQKKNRLIAEETRLRIKERKMRTRHLIELGGLVVKAKIDTLEKDTLYGALLSISEKLLENPSARTTWSEIGGNTFKEEKKLLTPIIVKFESEPSSDIRKSLRTHKLSWNKFRKEWYGNVEDLPSLKILLENIKHEIEIIES